MATIIKRGSRYRVQIRRKGHEPLSATFLTKREALSWVEKNEQGPKGTCSPIEALDRYSRSFTPNKKGAKQELVRIKAWGRSPLSCRFLHSISTMDLAKWRDGQMRAGKSPSTIRNALTIISQVYVVAVSEWGIKGLQNPVTSLRLPRPRPGRERRLEDEEEERLLSACEASGVPWMRPLVVALIETGMRRSELLGLRREHVHGSVAYLPRTKNGKSRAVPLSRRAKAAVAELLPYLPLSPVAVSYRWKLTVRIAGIEGLTLHDCRHEAVSRLFEKGLTTEEVMQVSGHSSYAALSRYTHLKAATLAVKLG
jgi:integrase